MYFERFFFASTAFCKVTFATRSLENIVRIFSSKKSVKITNENQFENFNEINDLGVNSLKFARLANQYYGDGGLLPVSWFIVASISVLVMTFPNFSYLYFLS